MGRLNVDLMKYRATALRILRHHLKHVSLLVHKLALRFGIIIMPKHYYVPLADINELSRTRHIWAKRSHLAGIPVDLKEQIENILRLVKPYQAEYLDNRAYLQAVEKHFGPGFGVIEAQALHGIIRSLKPKKIIEIGSGVSTYCMAEANRKNAEEGAETCELICIEPFPSEFLTNNNSIKLYQRKAEEVSDEVFKNLESGDLLFIDSSHTIRTGGDVLHIYLEVIPQLKPGVWIHIHDIYLPYDYQREADNTYLQAHETALLHALLIGNQQLHIVFCMSQLHYDAKDTLKDVFPNYTPQQDADGLALEKSNSLTPPKKGHFPSSIYLRTVTPYTAPC